MPSVFSSFSIYLQTLKTSNKKTARYNVNIPSINIRNKDIKYKSKQIMKMKNQQLFILQENNALKIK